MSSPRAECITTLRALVFGGEPNGLSEAEAAIGTYISTLSTADEKLVALRSLREIVTPNGGQGQPERALGAALVRHIDGLIHAWEDAV